MLGKFQLWEAFRSCAFSCFTREKTMTCTKNPSFVGSNGLRLPNKTQCFEVRELGGSNASVRGVQRKNWKMGFCTSGWLMFLTNEVKEMLSVFVALRRTRRAVRQESHTFALASLCVLMLQRRHMQSAICKAWVGAFFYLYTQKNRWDMSNGFPC